MHNAMNYASQWITQSNKLCMIGETVKTVHHLGVDGQFWLGGVDGVGCQLLDRFYIYPKAFQSTDIDELFNTMN